MHELPVISREFGSIAFARPIYKMNEQGCCENCKVPVLKPKRLQDNGQTILCECENCRQLLKLPKSEASVVCLECGFIYDSNVEACPYCLSPKSIPAEWCNCK